MEGRLLSEDSAKPERIAVVDDDQFVRRGLVRLLRISGFEVDEYESGEAFLCDYGLQPPKCAVLDIRLGGMTGPAVKREMDRSGKSAPVIFMTACDENETRTELLDLQDVPCLRKPFPPSELVALIRRHLRAETHVLAS